MAERSRPSRLVDAAGGAVGGAVGAVGGAVGAVGGAVGAVAALVASGLLCGCENAMKDMYSQAKYRPLAASPLWSDGRASRPLVAGTVPYSTGDLAGTSSGTRGEIRFSGRHTADYRLVSIRRGGERYAIYCAPCHGVAGDGGGYVTQRGFPPPPSYHSDRLRAATDQYLFDIIGNGYGVMYGYGERVPPDDRWAIVAYVRALQLSQNARMSDVPPSERQRLGDTVP